MLKIAITALLALLMITGLTACGTDGDNPGGETDTAEGSLLSKEDLNTTFWSRNNFAPMLKLCFGVEYDDVEDGGFSIWSVEGRYNPDKDACKMTLWYQPDPDISEYYPEMLFDLTRSLSSTGTVFAVAYSEETAKWVRDTGEYTDFTAYQNENGDRFLGGIAWCYLWNGQTILVSLGTSYNAYKVGFCDSDFDYSYLEAEE